MHDNSYTFGNVEEHVKEHDDSKIKAMPPLFTTSEIAEYLQVSTSTVYRLIRDGALKGVRVGQSLRFTRKNIEDFLDSCAVDEND
ncbi:MAG: helix-turn-helix domain-containing protein [Ancrocorticia sp.]|jgi:excisionase family DNA binding protein|nr:helix-turn-helix domain-containing protein [Ancrocorticia sp.]